MKGRGIMKIKVILQASAAKLSAKAQRPIGGQRIAGDDLEVRRFGPAIGAQAKRLRRIFQTEHHAIGQVGAAPLIVKVTTPAALTRVQNSYVVASDRVSVPLVSVSLVASELVV